MMEPSDIKQGSELHQRDALGHILTEAEKKTVAAYRARVEADEAVRLRPAALKQEAILGEQAVKIRDMESLINRTRLLRDQLLQSLHLAEQENAEIVREYAGLLPSPEPVR